MNVTQDEDGKLTYKGGPEDVKRWVDDILLEDKMYYEKGRGCPGLTVDELAILSTGKKPMWFYAELYRLIDTGKYRLVRNEDHDAEYDVK